MSEPIKFKSKTLLKKRNERIVTSGLRFGKSNAIEEETTDAFAENIIDGIINNSINTPYTTPIPIDILDKASVIRSFRDGILNDCSTTVTFYEKDMTCGEGTLKLTELINSAGRSILEFNIHTTVNENTGIVIIHAQEIYKKPTYNNPIPTTTGGDSGSKFKTQYMCKAIDTNDKVAEHKRVLGRIHDAIDIMEESDNKTITPEELSKELNEDMPTTYKILQELRRDEQVIKKGSNWILIDIKDQYLDWDGNLRRMRKLYNLKVPTLLIGDKGTGKSRCTDELSKLVNSDMETVNLSLRCRESHILGRLDVQEINGVQAVTWNKGPLPRTMINGSILYLDELSAGEPDVLLRLDESLDDRRQLTYENECIKAHENWWCTASINPLSTPGTKELPPQLISRFTTRLNFEYPPQDIEYKIINTHCNIKPYRDEMYDILTLFKKMRDTNELPYSPSIRESIVAGKLLCSDESVEETIELTILNAMYHWDKQLYKTARELARSLGLIKVGT